MLRRPRPAVRAPSHPSRETEAQRIEGASHRESGTTHCCLPSARLVKLTDAHVFTFTKTPTREHTCVRAHSRAGGLCWAAGQVCSAYDAHVTWVAYDVSRGCPVPGAHVCDTLPAVRHADERSVLSPCACTCVCKGGVAAVGVSQWVWRVWPESVTARGLWVRRPATYQALSVSKCL